ncbi:helix-turn-helix domain-containing protein [Clostridium sporogenes]|uniref:helix-turn-helix domain-containing protein n=1 Tax=Clostridium sporogenes TaxID=1509 RepID=UPI0022388F46|nr:helix-turn-helix domain-containing protein [Clostridium sporogenes]MCW6095580.1 helix-turn-helix domain-containing protein [Clostridium sporogenes]
MGRKAKTPFEIMYQCVLDVKENGKSAHQVAREIKVNRQSVLNWIARYDSLGVDGLKTITRNYSYSSELKQSAVLDYLNGKGSQLDICKKYKIRSCTQLQSWIMKYNSHDKLKSSTTGGNSIMTNGRKTTYIERVEIVKYCIEHENNYTETAIKYKVSYQQVYTWLKKYESKGIEGLIDKRGCKKSENEMSEIERLRVENKLLKAEKRRTELENILLKKCEEIERRRY